MNLGCSGREGHKGKRPRSPIIVSAPWKKPETLTDHYSIQAYNLQKMKKGGWDEGDVAKCLLGKTHQAPFWKMNWRIQNDRGLANRIKEGRGRLESHRGDQQEAESDVMASTHVKSAKSLKRLKNRERWENGGRRRRHEVSKVKKELKKIGGGAM